MSRVFFVLLSVCFFASDCRALDLLVTDNSRHAVWRFDTRTGQNLGFFVEPGSGGLKSPIGLTVGPYGRLYVASYGTDSILRFDLESGLFIDEFVSDVAVLGGPTDVLFDSEGRLVVSTAPDSTRGSVLRFDGATGAFLDALIPPLIGVGVRAEQLMLGEEADVYVAVHFPIDSVSRIDAETDVRIVEYRDEALDGPTGLALGFRDDLLVVGTGSKNLLRFALATGERLEELVSPGEGHMSDPTALVVGRDGQLFVVDRTLASILVFAGESGEFLESFGGPGQGLVRPWGAILVDPECQETESMLCLGAGRFRVTAQWSISGGQGDARAIPLSPIGGFFSFFSADNPEILVKVLDACEAYGSHWFFASGATNIGVTLSVVDTRTGESRVYPSIMGEPFEPILDTSSFSECGD